MSKSFQYFILAVLVVVSTTLVVLLTLDIDITTDFQNLTNQENTNPQTDNDFSYAKDTLGLDFSQPSPNPLNEELVASKFIQTAWIPDWDFNNGYNSLVQVADKLDSVSPVWYHVNDSGGVIVSRVGLNRLRSLRSSTGIKIIPSIANFSASEFSKILSDEGKLNEHIEFLKKEVREYDLDGLDLDYESIYLADQPAYFRLIRELYTFLDEQNKTLSIAVMPMWTEKNVLQSLVQTRKVQYWPAIADSVHEVRIMTYNVTTASSKYPGPIAPLDWMEANLRYARTKIDPNKIVLGIHLYAYGGWGENSEQINPYLSLYHNPFLDEIKASALVYSDIVERRSGTISDALDAESGEKILKYSRQGGNYIGYYMDGETVQLRDELARQYNAAGLAFWRMGGEDLGVYER